MKSRGIFYKIKQNTKQNITHRRDEFTSRRRALLYCIRFCYSLFIMSKKHYCSTPTVPLSYENPQHYQRSEFVAAHSRKVGTVSGDPPKTCIAPSLNPDRSAILQKSATLSKVGICRAPRALTVGRLSCR